MPARAPHIHLSMPPENKDSRAALLRSPDFRWLTAGSVLSMLGDQFTLIALPWLVLQMTGDTVVLGTVCLLYTSPSPRD